MSVERERITMDEAERRGYVYGQFGYNHAARRRIIAPLSVIKRISSGGLMDVKTLDDIREQLAEPEPAGDIPLA